MTEKIPALLVPLGAQVACVQRELSMREHVYPAQIQKGRMTQAQATAEIAAMRAVLETLRQLAAKEQLF